MSKPTNLQIAVGATFPVGSGVTNEITDERNFASGSVDPLASAVFALALRSEWNVTGRFFTRQVLASSSNDQKIGNYYEYSLQLNYAPLIREFSAYLGLTAINRGQDEIGKVPFPNSGGDWINLILGGSKRLIGKGESAFELWGEFQLPVYQNVNGVQLTEKWNIRLGVTVGLSLFGHDEGQSKKEDFGFPIQSS